MTRARIALAPGLVVAALWACLPADSKSSAADAATIAGNPAAVVRSAWPGPTAVQPVDRAGALGSNLSGLVAAMEHETVVLWAVRNGPSRLYRVVEDGERWRSDTAGGWTEGRQLRFPDGSGSPDAEGVTLTTGAAAGVYVASERDNDLGDLSRNSVLRFDVLAETGELTATHEWRLNQLLPTVHPNRGIEAITWIPDAHLVASGFRDAARDELYDPARYPDHGDGLFVVGLEANGALYVLALDHRTQQGSLVATVRTGRPAVMGLDYDGSARELWASCDESCGGGIDILAVDTVAASASAGAFIRTRAHAAPTGRPSSNHEGFALAPIAACADGLRDVFWADDNALAGHALRRGRIACAR